MRLVSDGNWVNQPCTRDWQQMLPGDFRLSKLRVSVVVAGEGGLRGGPIGPEKSPIGS
jgi:hypothetical protein